MGDSLALRARVPGHHDAPAHLSLSHAHTAARGAGPGVAAWLESPSLVLLAEDASYWARCERCWSGPCIDGPRVHDARVAALCLGLAVRELWTADRDFSSFPALRIGNPLIG